ncbi:MAG: acylphosphatase [Phycisphaerales bacterium]|nr:MAG: acylphosphatase [Phycisphaerales bacterium]
MPPSRYDIIFTGRVQGVFFRAVTRDVASGFAVTGWVRNEPDGSVRCVAEGDEKELDAFVAAVQRAKRDNIADTRIDRKSATGEFDDFDIRF